MDIHKKIKLLYNNTIRDFATRAGLHEQFRHIYYLLICSFNKNKITHKIGETEVMYVVTDYESWKRQQSFVGELGVMNMFSKDISDFDVVWDIGANVGTYTCLAGKAANDVNVYAFEPLDQNISTLKENIRINKINAKVIPKALSDTQCEMGFESPSSGGGGDYALTSGQGEITVETITGDAIIRLENVATPNIAKIDVEGAEVRVIKGLAENISEIKTLYIEVHPEKIINQGQSLNEMYDILNNNGFDHEKIDERGDQYFIRATK